MVKDIDIEDYNYLLADDKIAKYPLSNRDEAKLLFYDGLDIKDESFYNLPYLLRSDNLLVFNDTKVVYARLFFYKSTGSKIEIFCLEPIMPADFESSFCQKQIVKWKCLIGNNKKWKSGSLSATKIIDNIPITLSVTREEALDDSWAVVFSWNGGLSFAQVMQCFGTIPLPPYLNRQSIESDKQDYQTIYACFEGSVAAPTAGLHFTDRLFKDLRFEGIEHCFVTLHVGAGTFKPVSTKHIGDHIMHVEKVNITKDVISQLLAHLGSIICVGTTSVRTIESLYWYGVELINHHMEYVDMDIKQWYPYEQTTIISPQESLMAISDIMQRENLTHISGQTQLLIAPPYQYKLIKGIITNFHQPKSTLLLLVSAFIGDKWREVYDHALNNDYRFLSYGDACLFVK